MHFHGLFMYCLITSIGAPTAVNKQKLGLKIFFPIYALILSQILKVLIQDGEQGVPSSTAYRDGILFTRKVKNCLAIS
jgi:hypothetical protein